MYYPPDFTLGPRLSLLTRPLFPSSSTSSPSPREAGTATMVFSRSFNLCVSALILSLKNPPPAFPTPVDFLWSKPRKSTPPLLPGLGSPPSPWPLPPNNLDPPLEVGRSNPNPALWPPPSVDPVGVLSCGVGGVIVRNAGTAPGACVLTVTWLERCDLDDAMLELRLVDGPGIDVCDRRIDLGGDREKSTGDVPYKDDESSPLLSRESADSCGVPRSIELVANSRSLDCCAVLGRCLESLLPMMAPV